MGIQAKLPTSSLDDLTRTLRFTLAGPERQEVRETFLPAEWYPQSGLQLTWPHEGTDWAPQLDRVERTYLRMAFETARRERLLVATPETERVGRLLREQLPASVVANIRLYRVPTDDTWARDHAPLTLLTSQGPRLLDFTFNGWGEKFPHERDNLITSCLQEQGAFGSTALERVDFVLEGGSIESDGAGTLLTTAQCLLAPHRNQPLSLPDIEARLLHYFHAQRVLFLRHGHLAGDDTDGHVDTLARFCPSGAIAYVRCDDPADEHYASLHAMEQELLSFRTAEGRPYRLIPLPMAAPAYDDDGRRLPATYANFLILNQAVLLPTYGTPLDDVARRRLALAFPRHTIIPIDARPLILQHGSVHCCAMQYPLGVKIST